MINLHTKFDVSTITCNEDMKGNAKYVNILVLSHPLWDLGGNAQGSSMARWKVHRQLRISDKNERILVKIVVFERRGWVTLNANLRGTGRRPPTVGIKN